MPQTSSTAMITITVATNPFRSRFTMLRLNGEETGRDRDQGPDRARPSVRQRCVSMSAITMTIGDGEARWPMLCGAARSSPGNAWACISRAPRQPAHDHDRSRASRPDRDRDRATCRCRPFGQQPHRNLLRGALPDAWRRYAVADAIIDHARTEHHHSLDRDVVLAHPERVHPHERDG